MRHVKMEGAPVVASQVGGRDTLAPGSGALQGQWPGYVRGDYASKVTFCDST